VDRPCTTRFGPHPCFEKVPSAVVAATTRTWAGESASAVEWAHALAPAADLLLVEARSNQMEDLVAAVRNATDLGATVVTMTWGMPEQPDFRQYDILFAAPGVAFVAASGDFGHGVNYPAASPRVIAVGGTVLDLDGSGRRTGKEFAWSGSGGGVSSTESAPEYQRFWDPAAGGRSVPDVSIAASPTFGFASYSTGGGGTGWRQVMGTSVGAVLWAALIALINQRIGRIVETAAPLYKAANAAGGRPFDNIAQGSNGECGSQCLARDGYNEITGLGTPNVPRLLDALKASG
jgi:subtilase family serine protease